jgi:hypothetical protein
MVALAGALVLPATAAADTVKIGSALTNGPPQSALCTGCVGVQTSQVGGSGPLSLTAPVNGTVTSWAVRTNDTGALHTLRILRPTGIGYLGAGRSVAPAAVPNNTDTTYTYTASLPIKVGDAIGIELNAGHDLPQFTSNQATDVTAYLFPVFPDGTTSGAFTGIPGHELLLQATIKFCKVPDLSGQKTAAAQQLLAAGDCAAGPIAKKKLKRTKKNKKRKKGKVLSQALAPGTATSPTDAIGFTIGKLKKK